MRILHLANFGVSKVNGISEVVLNLAESQRKCGATVCVGITYQQENRNRDDVVYINSKQEFLNLLSSFKPDVVICQGIYDFPHVYFSWILNKRKIPYIIVFHGAASKFANRQKWLKKKIANIVFFRRYIKKASKVIYLNQQEADKSIFRHVNPNYSIIPNGVNIPQCEYEERDRHVINVSFLSRISIYYKGIGLLMEAIESLKQEKLIEKFYFSFYGFGYNDCEALFKPLGANGKYFGPVYGSEKENAFRKCDVFILPSRSEGMPVSVLEALSYGIPCIVSKETNMGDVVVNNRAGWLCELSAESIKECLLKAYDELRDHSQELFENSRRAALDYSWETIAQNSLMAYKEVLGEK